MNGCQRSQGRGFGGKDASIFVGHVGRQACRPRGRIELHVMRRGVAAARGRFDHPGKNDKGEAPRASTMAARKRNKGGNTGTAAAAARAAAASSGGGAKADQRARLDSKVKAELRGRHLAPLPLVLAVLVCSGVTWVLAFRDLMATGRPIMGAMDEAMLVSAESCPVLNPVLNPALTFLDLPCCLAVSI